MNWQDAILAHFEPKRERMLLVVDPDNLLRDDALLAAIHNRTYDVLEFQDEVSFRNQFERNYRNRWDRGDDVHIVVIVHLKDAERQVPYDLWKKSHRIELNVADLFPKLNALVVRELDNAFYADLYPAQQSLAPNDNLATERATNDFILRVVFGLDPVGVRDPALWVAFLIHRHYNARALPASLEDYVVRELLPRAGQSGLRPEFLTNATAFYGWLSDQWAGYISALATGKPVTGINFADPLLRPLLGQLFAEELIRRAPAPADLPANSSWVVIGLSTPGKEVTRESQVVQKLYELRALLAQFRDMDIAALPAGKSDLREWLNLSVRWAGLVYRANSLPDEAYSEIQPEFFATRESLDGRFREFVRARYGAAGYYEDNKGPISLAGVNNWLVQQTAGSELARLALICFDGLALDQWCLLRDYLRAKLPGVSFIENRTYALAPTITPISRQALFAGRPPSAFADTWSRTDKDADRWQAFWANHGVPERRIAYLSVDPSDAQMPELHSVIDSTNRRLGLLVTLFDHALHKTDGMPARADKRVYYDYVRSALANGYLSHVIDLLLTHRYRIFVTSDHGNIAGIGNGLTPLKALVETYARRVAIFDREPLAEEYARTNGLQVFRTKSLPPDVYPVYLPGVTMFGTQGQAALSHGGLSLEELVVPFVEVRRS